MNCTEFELAVHARLDARQHYWDAELRAHADLCPACQSLWTEQLALLSLTKSWSPPAPPPGLIEAVLAELVPSPTVSRTQTGAPARVGPRSVGSVLGTACSLAVMLLLSVTLIRMVPPAPQSPVEFSASSTAPAEETLVSQALSGLWQGVSEDYAELSGETSRVMRDWKELPESAGLLPELPLRESSTTEPPPEWLRLDRPVSERVGQAFDFLWDALPRTPPQSS